MKFLKETISNLLCLVNSFEMRFITRNVATEFETLQQINNGKSLIRFGDGEISIITNSDIGFQKFDRDLKHRLIKIIKSSNDGLIICIPGPIGNKDDYLTEKAKDFWANHKKHAFCYWAFYTKKNKQYYNTQVTRCYIDINRIQITKTLFNEWKKLWEKRNILIVEGEFTRMGIMNDLFSNSQRIRRIIAPSTNAYSNYKRILNSILINRQKDELILISLGPTAKVLVYDLFLNGITAIDVGHLDIEYDWYLSGMHNRTKIRNKYINEIVNGNIVDSCIDQKYQSSIIERIL